MIEFLVGPFGASVLCGVGIGAVVFVISALGFQLGVLSAPLAAVMRCVAVALWGLFPAWMTVFYASILLTSDKAMSFGTWAFIFALTLMSVWLTLSAVTAYRRVSDDDWAR